MHEIKRISDLGLKARDDIISFSGLTMAMKSIAGIISSCESGELCYKNVGEAIYWFGKMKKACELGINMLAEERTFGEVWEENNPGKKYPEDF